MSRSFAFISLVLLAAAFFVVGSRFEANFLSDLWSQLFLLTVGTLSTTFVLDALLRRREQQRSRAADAFALRSFIATMLKPIQQMVGPEQTNEKLFEAVLAGNKEFEAAAHQVLFMVEGSTNFEPASYVKYRLDISDGLRTLARQYIRLFSSDRNMLTSIGS
jgi:hypothetical protein